MENELYKKMYFRLFNKVTDAIEICEDESVKDILIKAQQETEEMYMSYNMLNITK
ncbi:MAG: hypothetical protein IJ025_09270 [Clostridia bacterium]|nr:hypothetical protein [Clostridia bacterium]